MQTITLIISVVTLILVAWMMLTQKTPTEWDDAGANVKLDIIMAAIDDLTNALDRISTDVDSVLAQVVELKAELQNLQSTTPTEVDLTPAIAKAAAIADRLEGVSSAASGATG